MLKLISEDTLHLNNKFFSINVTNVCNLSCSGCNQLCGLYPKEKNWFISIEDFKFSIECFREYIKINWARKDYPKENKYCGLYGGEPTLHPSFEEIISILHENDDLPFCIYTNGRTFLDQLKEIDLSPCYGRDIMPQIMKLNLTRSSNFEVLQKFPVHEKNIAYRIDLKTKDVMRKFVPTLCAPCDIQSNNLSKNDFVKQAKKVCFQWNNCENVIYNGKAYACHLAAAMDLMFYNGENGWKINDKKPFLKTKKEIDEQLSNFCYRCGYNLHRGMRGFEEHTNSEQFTVEDTLATKTNYSDKIKNLKLLNVIQ